MPRKRRAATPECSEDDLSCCSEEKRDDSRAPRNAANARERARMRVLSRAFSRLKTTLPWVPADTKLSKLDTLRLAATYIAHLRAVLRDDGTEPRSLSLALSWPFALQPGNATSSNSCGGISSSNSNQQYLSQQQTELQCFHQPVSLRHEPQLSYF
ncbi:transcription factor 21 [Ceratina calcarata]|uniref:Transcription factor 21 n=1 Tax=Ceratina calcarata TaxID=156304 RepID=A0AAJ7N645_9HYME|nr:transcription factor 21 [Ceratina calcarata]